MLEKKILKMGGESSTIELKKKNREALIYKGKDLNQKWRKYMNCKVKQKKKTLQFLKMKT